VENELMGTGKQLIGIVEGCSVPQIFIPKLIEYYQKGLFPFDKLVTYYNFEDINQAFEDTKNGKVIKAILKMND
jgi:aryl-alcohol dehydrogenase